MTFLLRTPFHSQLFWAIMWMSGFVKHRREWKCRQNFSRSWGMIWFLKPPFFPDNTEVLWNLLRTMEFWQSIKPYAMICKSCGRGPMVTSPCVLVIVLWLYQNIGGKCFIFSPGLQGSVHGPIGAIWETELLATGRIGKGGCSPDDNWKTKRERDWGPQMSS